MQTATGLAIFEQKPYLTLTFFPETARPELGIAKDKGLERAAGCHKR